MFKRRKQKEQLKQYGAILQSLMNMSETIEKESDELQGLQMGELSHVAAIKGLMLSLDTLIMAYINNPLSLPSTALELPKKFNDINKMFIKVCQIQTQIAEINIKLKDITAQVIREPNMKFELEPVKTNLEMHLGDRIGVTTIQISQLKFRIRQFQNVIIPEHTVVALGLDVLEERNKMKSINKDGISYSIDFKLVPKNEQLNINNSKEVSSNDTKRGKTPE